jgi:hypothetical protein
MNNQLLQDFNTSIGTIRPTIQEYTKTPIKLSTITKTGKAFYWENNIVEETALKDLLNILSIKNTLLDEIRDDKDQWEPLHRCLSNIKNDRDITAIRNSNGNDAPRIVRFQDTPLKEEVKLDLDKGIDLIGSYLESQTNNVSLHNLSFNRHSLQLEAQFRDNDKIADVFGDGNDLWNTGFSLYFGETKSNVLPFFLRQICSNGMMATHMASQRYFENREFKQTSFNKLINKVVKEDLVDVARKNSERLRNNKTSLREFFTARNILLEESNELANTYFNDEVIREAYKNEKLKAKNTRWLSTANSNINSYDFFNNITHCVSHQKISDVTRMQLNTAASEIFFKGPDFSYRAPDPFSVILN